MNIFGLFEKKVPVKRRSYHRHDWWVYKIVIINQSAGATAPVHIHEYFKCHNCDKKRDSMSWSKSVEIVKDNERIY